MGAVISRAANNRVAVSMGVGICSALLSGWALSYMTDAKPSVIIAPIVLNEGVKVVDKDIIGKVQDVFRENPLLAVVSRPLFALNAILTGIF
jgi:hypothetical protein